MIYFLIVLAICFALLILWFSAFIIEKKRLWNKHLFEKTKAQKYKRTFFEMYFTDSKKNLGFDYYDSWNGTFYLVYKKILERIVYFSKSSKYMFWIMEASRLSAFIWFIVSYKYAVGTPDFNSLYLFASLASLNLLFRLLTLIYVLKKHEFEINNWFFIIWDELLNTVFSRIAFIVVGYVFNSTSLVAEEDKTNAILKSLRIKDKERIKKDFIASDEQGDYLKINIIKKGFFKFFFNWPIKGFDFSWSKMSNKNQKLISIEKYHLNSGFDEFCNGVWERRNFKTYFSDLFISIFKILLFPIWLFVNALIFEFWILFGLIYMTIFLATLGSINLLVLVFISSPYRFYFGRISAKDNFFELVPKNWKYWRVVIL